MEHLNWDTEGEASVCKIMSDSWHNILSITAIVSQKHAKTNFKNLIVLL